MLYIEYRGIYQNVLKIALMRTYGLMGAHTDDRATETKILDRGVISM